MLQIEKNIQYVRKMYLDANDLKIILEHDGKPVREELKILIENLRILEDQLNKEALYQRALINLDQCAVLEKSDGEGGILEVIMKVY